METKNKNDGKPSFRLHSKEFDREYIIDINKGGKEAAIEACNKDLHDKMVSDALLAGLSTLNATICGYLVATDPKSREGAAFILGVSIVCIINRLLTIRKEKRIKKNIIGAIDFLEEKVFKKE